MIAVFDFQRTVVFLSKLWEAILSVDKLPENAGTDKLDRILSKDIYYDNLKLHCNEYDIIKV